MYLISEEDMKKVETIAGALFDTPIGEELKDIIRRIRSAYVRTEDKDRS